MMIKLKRKREGSESFRRVRTRIGEDAYLSVAARMENGEEKRYVLVYYIVRNPKEDKGFNITKLQYCP